MKVIVYYREGLGWAIKLASSVGVSAGKTVYPTKEEAIQEAKTQHPNKEIVVESP